MGGNGSRGVNRDPWSASGLRFLRLRLLHRVLEVNHGLDDHPDLQEEDDQIDPEEEPVSGGVEVTQVEEHGPSSHDDHEEHGN